MQAKVLSASTWGGGERMKVKKAVGLFGFERTGWENYSVANKLCYRRRKDEPEGDLEIVKTTSFVSAGLMTSALGAGPQPCRAMGVRFPARALGVDSTSPVSLECRASNQRGLFLNIKISWDLPCYVLNLVGFLLFNFSFLLFNFSLLEWKWLSFHCILGAHNLFGFTGS